MLSFWYQLLTYYFVPILDKKKKREVYNHTSRWKEIPAAQISTGPAFTHIVLFYKQIDSSIKVASSDEGCYYHLRMYHHPALERAWSSKNKMVTAFNNGMVQSFNNGGGTIFQKWSGKIIQQ